MQQRYNSWFLMGFLFLISCGASSQPESAWIKPQGENLDLDALGLDNSELISLTNSLEGIQPFQTSENLTRGDERSHFQEKLFYNSLGFADFLGTFDLTFYEVPFRNEFALSLKVSSLLWDQSGKRSREFLPLASPSAELLFVPSPSSLSKDNEKSQEVQLSYPMLWDRSRDALSYEALLTPRELTELIKSFKTYPEGRLYLHIGERNYDITDLKSALNKNFAFLSSVIAERQGVSLSTLERLSTSVPGRRKFTSPWLPLSSFFVKVQSFYTTSATSASRLEFILGSYNPTALRNVFTGNASLVFSTSSQAFFLTFEKTSFFSTLQKKQSALLSFATIPIVGADFFEASTWKGQPKEFWQINLNSQPISVEDLITFNAILSDPTHTVSLSLTEDMLYSSGGWLNYSLNLFHWLHALKVPQNTAVETIKVPTPPDPPIAND